MYNAAQDLYVDHLHGSNGVTEKIKRAMYESAKQFVYIGFLLREVKEYRYYEEGSYQDVYAYAEHELGFKRSSKKNFIAIAENFGVNEYTYGGQLHREQTMHLQPKYEKFNYSQLVELLAMSERQRQLAKPDMTVKQLRELKKEPIIEQVTIEELEAKTSGQTSGQIQKKSDQKWNDASWWTPELYDRKLKLVIIEWNKNNRQFGIGYYNGHEEQWHDQPGNKIKVTHWMDLPYMPEKSQD